MPEYRAIAFIFKEGRRHFAQTYLGSFGPPVVEFKTKCTITSLVHLLEKASVFVEHAVLYLLGISVSKLFPKCLDVRDMRRRNFWQSCGGHGELALCKLVRMDGKKLSMFSDNSTPTRFLHQPLYPRSRRRPVSHHPG